MKSFMFEVDPSPSNTPGRVSQRSNQHNETVGGIRSDRGQGAMFTNFANTARPNSARLNHFNSSFVSQRAESTGAVHFKNQSNRILQHRGDIPGLGKHYNPVKSTTLPPE